MNVVYGEFGDARTPKQIALDAFEQADDYKCVVVVALDKDGFIVVGWSDGSMLKRIGMLDLAKIEMIERAQDD